VSPTRHRTGAFRRGFDEVARVYLNELSEDAITVGDCETLSAQDQSALAIEGPAVCPTPRTTHLDREPQVSDQAVAIAVP